MSREHTRDPNSRTGKVRAFFEANPGVNFKCIDIAKKFDITKRQASGVIQWLKKQGICESIHVVRLKSKDVENNEQVER